MPNTLTIDGIVLAFPHSLDNLDVIALACPAPVTTCDTRSATLARMSTPAPDLLVLARTKFYAEHIDHYLHPVRFPYESTPRPCVEVHRIDCAPDVPPVTTYLVIEREGGAVELVHADE